MTLDGQRRRTMFGKRKWKRLAEVVSLVNPTEARKSTTWLKRHFRELKSREHKVAVKRATVLASVRAEAMLKKKDLSSKERAEFRKIAKIYKTAYKSMELD